jgi:putative ABC transport system permease protein
VTTRPPRFADALLRLILPREDAEVIAGDLEETLRTSASRSDIGAAFWYWRQVLSIVYARLTRPGLDGPSSRLKSRRMTLMRQDLSYAVRSLLKRPGFAAMAVAMLAIGIGANVAIFSLVNVILLKPLPFASPDRLMFLQMLAPTREMPGPAAAANPVPTIWSYPKYLALRDGQRIFESTALYASDDWNITGSDSPERVTGEVVESTYFDVLGIAPRLGRTFAASEAHAPGSAPLVVLAHGFWTRRFGGDAGVIGRTFGLDGIPHTILGVMPPGFSGLTGEANVWVPVTTRPASHLEGAWDHSYSAVGRLKPGATYDEAEAEIAVLGGRIDAQFRPPGGGAAWGARAVALDRERVDPITRRSVLLLLLAVASVLLIVCVNLANLVFARALARQREIAIRLALGATRVRIVSQLMTESLVLALAGAIGGLIVAYGIVSAGAALLPDLQMVLQGRTAGLTRVGLAMIGLDGTTLLFTIGLVAATTVLFGLGPAWRTSRRDVTATMKSGSTGAVSEGHAGFGIRQLLIVTEIALALVLLSAGGLMLKSVARLQATALGFRPDSVLSFRLAMSPPQYDQARATQLFVELLDRLSGLAPIESVAYGGCAPISGGCNGTTASFPDRPVVPGARKPPVGVMWASPRYFETLGIPVVRGRVFSAQDRAGQPKVVVINEAAARAFWGSEDPIGKRIAVGQGGFGDGAEVVGVVADVRYRTVESAVGPDVYLPLLQSTRPRGVIFVRSRSAAAALVPLLRREVHALDPDLPLTDVKSMDERLGDATWRPRMMAWILGAFAAMALVLAALGIYGVMAQGVRQRTREIGVRLALGAAYADIMKLIVGRVLIIAVMGIGLGLISAIPSMRLLVSLLYQVSPADPAVLGGLALLLLFVALLAGYLPARQAARVDPLETLKAD